MHRTRTTRVAGIVWWVMSPETERHLVGELRRYVFRHGLRRLMALGHRQSRFYRSVENWEIRRLVRRVRNWYLARLAVRRG